ncbi:MAG: bifunctional phosphoribosylaminoimidazolecarboxamide formyltransferase/IMP cyclohydrolase [Candidatus Auribacterota bacterium]|nr:bifunctional phosphoribosylaminoimidazolecarboxamide formyltransferase/IMP cyclohydrolase [Candidatus Auribacterota bacterium]
MQKITRALISVSDKTGIVEFARALTDMGVEIISTGGTARQLEDAGIPLIRVSQYTGFPEMLDGRVKTLHPKIHAGLLALWDKTSHKEDLIKHEIDAINMVVVNLYPFYETVVKPGITKEDIIENIDIGGPTMLRSAAKNFRFVTCVCTPSRYGEVIDAMKNNDGRVPDELRLNLAYEVFLMTSTYDSVIAHYFSTIQPGDEPAFPDQFSIPLKRIQDLRYGENPHQKAALYKLAIDSCDALTGARQLQGKELSYNNIVDLDSAYRLVCEFEKPAAVIVKHNNPCGVAQADDLLTAYKRAHATDPVSAFGSIQAFNTTVDIGLALEINSTFVEAVLAPDYTDEALQEFSRKKNLRILKTGKKPFVPALNFSCDIKRIKGGLLIQDMDERMITADTVECITKAKPSPQQLESLLFCWKVVKHVKSNAIIFASGTETVGIGAGQMSRIDSTMLAAKKSQKPLEDIVMASDAFFPFRDNIDEAAKYGVKAIIQPGGSIRDQEVIDACNEYGIAMVVTGVRHFKH